DAGPGIEIEDESVRGVDAAHTRSPGVDFENSHLGKADQPPLVLHVEILAARLLLLNHHRPEVLGDAGARMLLEEAGLALPLGTPEQAQGSLDNVREYPGIDSVIEAREIALGQPLLGIEDAVGMAEPPPRHHVRATFPHRCSILNSLHRRTRRPRHLT